MFLTYMVYFILLWNGFLAGWTCTQTVSVINGWYQYGYYCEAPPESFAPPQTLE